MGNKLSPLQFGLGTKPSRGAQCLKLDFTTADFIAAAFAALTPVIQNPEDFYNTGAYGSWGAGNGDWRSSFLISVQLQDLMSQLHMGAIQSVYVDNSCNPSGLVLRFGGIGGQQINVPPFIQGTFPVLSYPAPQVDIFYTDHSAWQTFILAAGAVNNHLVSLEFYDIITPYTTWETRARIGAWQDASGSIGAGQVTPNFGQVLYGNPFRKGILIQNQSGAGEPLYWNTAGFDGFVMLSATMANSYELLPGQTYQLVGRDMFRDPIYLSAATLGHTFVVKELW